MIAVLLCWHPGLVRGKSYWQVAATLGLLSTFKKRRFPSFFPFALLPSPPPRDEYRLTKFNFAEKMGGYF
ncbi:MAG: hypothetical protein QHH43_09930 [Candidatus Saccharicenans sp.]|jgi:hypothetical protein|nr:hypothetical protein [Candidatus Saccharicenans sp.]MDH7576062.1 hypothetical protein [Candidatus Saccharicenans sp.]